MYYPVIQSASPCENRQRGGGVQDYGFKFDKRNYGRGKAAGDERNRGTFAWRRSLYRKYWIYIYIKRQIVLEWS